MSVLTNASSHCTDRYTDAFLLGVVPGASDLTDDDLPATIRYMYAFAVGLAPFNLGGDDVPRVKVPNKGFDEKQWRERNKFNLDVQEQTGKPTPVPVKARPALKPLPKKAVPRSTMSESQKMNQMLQRWDENKSRIMGRK